MTRISLLWPAVLVALVASDAAAQGTTTSDTWRVELWGGVTGVLSGHTSALSTSYSPPLLFDGDFTSHGGQILAIDTGTIAGLAGGVNVFPAKRLGMQVLVDRASARVSGTNSAYTIGLQYVSRPPPASDPQTVTVNQIIAWPDTVGSLTQTSVAFNAIVRIGRPGRLSATLSGGPTYDRITGTVQPLGYTTFHLGGHSVLFEDEYRLDAALEAEHAVGLNGGGDLEVPVGRHVAVIAGYRIFGGRDASLAATPTTILNPDELTAAQSIDEIAARLAADPVRMSRSRSQVFVGVKFTVGHGL